MSGRLPQGALIVLAIVAALVFGWSGNDRDEAAQQSVDAAALPFDFYVLALSWSPAYCASEAGSRSPLQCGTGADFGFITHGLWPQFEEGWPSFCQSPHGDSMPAAVADGLIDIMPDRGLIAHQWDKHGTCSGLSPARYVALTRQASASITIPPLFAQRPPSRIDAEQIEFAFAAANPGLTEEAIAVACPNRRFTEVRICLDQDLSPRACAQVDRNGCRSEGLQIVPR